MEKTAYYVSISDWSSDVCSSDLRQLKRPTPLHRGGAEFGVSLRRQVAERGVWPDRVVIVLPGRQHDPGLSQRGKQRLVEQFVPQPTVEALDEAVLLRFARRDVMPFDPLLLAPERSEEHTSDLQS